MSLSRHVNAMMSGVATSAVGGDDAIERVRVRILPDGRVSAEHAAAYLGHATKTLAMWRLRGIGPAWCKVGGKIFYRQAELDRFVAGGEAS